MVPSAQETLNALLEKAVEKIDVGRAEACLDKGADVHHQIRLYQSLKSNSDQNVTGYVQSPLFFKILQRATFSSHMADLFIARGVDINKITDEKGNTPLLIAILTEEEDAAKYLIAKGAKTDVVNKEGVSPITATQYLTSATYHGQNESYKEIFTKMILKAMPTQSNLKKDFEKSGYSEGLRKPLKKPKKAVLRRPPKASDTKEKAPEDKTPADNNASKKGKFRYGQ